MVNYLNSGAETTVTDPAGRRRKYGYDALGRTVKVTQEDTQEDRNVEATYEYDALNCAVSECTQAISVV
jgi:YD repeat-containing protein